MAAAQKAHQPDRRRSISPDCCRRRWTLRAIHIMRISSIDGLLWPNNTMPHSLRNLLARSRAHRIDPKTAQGVFLKAAIALAGSKSSIPAKSRNSTTSTRQDRQRSVCEPLPSHPLSGFGDDDRLVRTRRSSTPQQAQCNRSRAIVCRRISSTHPLRPRVFA